MTLRRREFLCRHVAAPIGAGVGASMGAPRVLAWITLLGALDMEMFRAVRLVVDTGLHAKAWPRRRAVEYMATNTSLERTFCENEVDRYIAWPAQATGYKLGEITIRRLQRKAEGTLGKRFDVKRFHAQVLDTGAIPLGVLAMKVDAWIREGGS